MLSERVQPDLKLAAALFDSLERATRNNPGIVRDSYGAGEQAAHDIMRAAAESMGLEVTYTAGRGYTGSRPIDSPQIFSLAGI